MDLSKNVGSIDKVIRLLVGIALIGWGVLSSGLSEATGIAASLVGLILITTGLINFCPLFKIFGISSFKGDNS